MIDRVDEFTVQCYMQGDECRLMQPPNDDIKHAIFYKYDAGIDTVRPNILIVGPR
jgi:hypothetical protein